MSDRRLSTGQSVGLLLALLLVVGLVLGGLASTVLLPQGQVVVVLLAAVLFFLVAQVLVFRLLGLRSKADEERPADEPAADEDWRAWRG